MIAKVFNMGMLTAIVAACTAVVGQGCAPRRENPGLHLDSTDPLERGRAAIEAGRRHERSEVPPLVERLEDEDPAVRFYAILALERLTGTRMGYDYAAPASERVTAVERWRRFLIESAAQSAAGVESGERR